MQVGINLADGERADRNCGQNDEHREPILKDEELAV